MSKGQRALEQEKDSLVCRCRELELGNEILISVNKQLSEEINELNYRCLTLQEIIVGHRERLRVLQEVTRERGNQK